MSLPPGLTLRTARPEDLDQIGALLSERGEPDDAVDHRLVVEDPDLGWEACAVVVDGERVVSTATLLDETVRLGGVTLPAGQVELVATDAAYEGRGLVRALMAWAHERSARRGHVLQVMIGIPYFYRLFGYEYAIDMAPARALRDTAGLPPAPTGVRPAGPRDLPALAALQDLAQAASDVAVPHPAARLRWLLAHDSSTTWVLEAGGEVRASARVNGDLVAEATARDAPAADLLLAALADRAEDGLRVVHRVGTVTGRAWDHRLGEADPQCEQYYLRVPDPAVVLDRLRPVLGARLAAAGLAVPGTDLLITTFRHHYRIPVTATGLGDVVEGGTMQGANGGMAVAPDRLPALLFGGLGLDGLSRRHPDVYPGVAGDTYRALFPPVTADVLSYYLPW